MHSKHRAIRLALLASLAASGMVAAQTTTTDQPATSNQPAPASTPSDPNVPADNPATGAAGGPSAGRKKEATEEIVVTGSRIRRKDLTTPAPVTVISREQVTASGKVSIGEFLQSLPEQGNAINTQFNNGGDGATRISLRGLGSPRTLVLMNGRRMVPGGTGADASVDLNTIPTAAVERIEVLKDGASAVYGSDAIAGVVNIITRRGFKGTELSAYGGISQHGDGNTYDLNVTTGQAGDRGNVVFSAGYYRQETVWAGDRDFSKYQLFFDPAATECPHSASGSCIGKVGEILVGSGTIPAGRIILSKADRDANGVNLPNGSTGWNNLVFPNVGMPHVLWELQGEQTLKVEERQGQHGKQHVKTLALSAPGALDARAYDALVADLVNYLMFMGEPARQTRMQIGYVVLIFLGVLFVPIYLLKQDYWKEVH